MKIRLSILTLLILVMLNLRAGEAAALPEPGPENGGLRLRLMVVSRSEASKEGYAVRVDILNTSKRAITLRAGWKNDEQGDLKDYIDAATSIECIPATPKWRGGVVQNQSMSPQPEHVLKADAVLSVRWETEGRHLKNRVTNPNNVQNPEFQFPGLYSVHATIKIITSESTVSLRSNEQLVMVGGSRAMPKHTVGQLSQVGADGKTATLGLGSQHKIDLGDQFEHRSKREHWKLTVTEVKPSYSKGNLELLFPASSKPPLTGMEVTFIQKK